MTVHYDLQLSVTNCCCIVLPHHYTLKTYNVTVFSSESQVAAHPNVMVNT